MKQQNVFTSKEVLDKDTKDLLSNPSEISPKKSAHQWQLIHTFGFPSKENVT